jgi:betaine reductase
MSDVRALLGEALQELIDAARSGGPRRRIGLMARGSEHGAEEMIRGARLAREQDPRVLPVLIGPRVAEAEGLEGIETPDCEADVARAMESALAEGRIEGAVALHYPFPVGVATIGRVLTPARGRTLWIASTTGASATGRPEAMLRNALLGVAAARAVGNPEPSVGILNVEGAPTVARALGRLREGGYPLRLAESVRAEGGAILRGNDLLAGAADVCVTDTLTGNVLMKLFSAWTTGGSYEALGWGYGPSAGEGWDRVVSIISRASGAPVIAGALSLTALAVAGGLPERVREEFASARRAGLEEILADLAPRAAVGPEVPAPPKVPTEEEIHGLDVLAIDEAVRALWREGIYAESAMGCTGPVVKVPGRELERARAVLAREGHL